MNVKAILLVGSVISAVAGVPATAEAGKRSRCCYNQCAPTCCAPAYACCAPALCVAASSMDDSAVKRELIQLRFDHDRLRADFDALKGQVDTKSK